MNAIIDKTINQLAKYHDIPLTKQHLTGTTPIKLGTVMDAAQKSQNTHEKPYVQSNFTFDPNEQTLKIKAKTIRLTEKETALLKILTDADGKPTPRDHILKTVWGYVSDLETHTLETHIYRLRQKIEHDPSNPTIIITDGDGYRITTNDHP